ncbi:MAG: hypothetical protein V1909_06440 [Candidatus Micrarchaeota archaeon]
MRELRRKLFHLGLGAFVIGLALNPDREYAILFLFGAFLAGLGVLSLKLRGLFVPLADELLTRLSRKDEPPGYGAFWYVTGMLLILTFVKPDGYMLASLMMLCISDATSALVGRMGSHKLPYNKIKTFEGTLAFVIVSAVSFFWLGPIAIPFALFGALIESIDSRLDDNLRIAVFCIVFFFAARIA